MLGQATRGASASNRRGCDEVPAPASGAGLVEAEAFCTAPAAAAAVALSVVRPHRHHHLPAVGYLHALERRPIQADQRSQILFPPKSLPLLSISAFENPRNLGAERCSSLLSCLLTTEPSGELKIWEGWITSTGPRSPPGRSSSRAVTSEKTVWV